MQSQETDSFAVRLRRLMADRGVGISSLARMAKMTDQTVNRYRTGRVVPQDHWGYPTANAIRLARALDVDVSELFPPRRQS